MHFQTKISQITMYFQSKNDFYYGVMSYILCVIEPSSVYIDLVFL